jgi:hypothetical protein
MQASQTPFQPHPSVVFTRLDDAEAVLLHLDTKLYYSLNETGLRIWELVQDGVRPTEISMALQEAYDIEHEQALVYVLEFLHALQQEGLVHPETS